MVYNLGFRFSATDEVCAVSRCSTRWRRVSADTRKTEAPDP